MTLPGLPRRQDSTAAFSVASTTRATAQEVHDLIYGLDRHTEHGEAGLRRLYDPNASTYENPILTATSRALILDVCHATRQLSELDMPRPLTLLAAIFGRGKAAGSEPWFRALRVWSEIHDICDSESFDGHRRSIIDHTLHVLLLPGLHAGHDGSANSDASLDLFAPQYQQSQSGSAHQQQQPLPPPHASLYSLPYLQRTSQPALPLLGTRITVPSPLHLQLRVLSRIEFNDLGRVTHHRDFWDVKDLLSLVPGAALAQFVGTRIAARALAIAGNLGAWLVGRKRSEENDDIEWSGTAATDNSLGLLGIDLPDVDRDTS